LSIEKDPQQIYFKSKNSSTSLTCKESPLYENRSYYISGQLKPSEKFHTTFYARANI